MLVIVFHSFYHVNGVLCHHIIAEFLACQFLHHQHRIMQNSCYRYSANGLIGYGDMICRWSGGGILYNNISEKPVTILFRHILLRKFCTVDSLSAAKFWVTIVIPLKTTSCALSYAMSMNNKGDVWMKWDVYLLALKKIVYQTVMKSYNLCSYNLRWAIIFNKTVYI